MKRRARAHRQRYPTYGVKTMLSRLKTSHTDSDTDASTGSDTTYFPALQACGETGLATAGLLGADSPPYIHTFWDL